MPSFSESSVNQLGTCTSDLQKVLRRAIKVIDFKILEGHRDKEAQNRAYDDGKSKLRWPEGKHNSLPSRAVDLAPHPVIWPTPSMKQNDPDRYNKVIARFYLLAGVIMAVADEMGVKLRWGGDWDGDYDLFDQNFDDIGHFEEVD